jgi:hypothetical protein
MKICFQEQSREDFEKMSVEDLLRLRSFFGRRYCDCGFEDKCPRAEECKVRRFENASLIQEVLEGVQ